MASTVPLGDKQLTRIGLGTNRLTNTPENRELLKAAVAETALNHIDTAHLYTAGESEQTIGAALSPFPDDLLVATKGGYNEGGGIDGFRAELEQSFERLRTEVIEPQISKHSGRLFKAMGDGFLVEFASAVEAVACAVAIPRARFSSSR